MLTFYDEIPDMRMIAGDTLPVFNIFVDKTGLTEYTMYCVVTKANDTTQAIIYKECEETETGFAVQLNTADTVRLSEGIYTIAFRLVADGLEFVKLKGTVYVSNLARS